MRTSLVIFFLALLGMCTNAQSAKVAQWRMIVKMTTPTTGECIVKGTIDAGWHVYGTSLPKGGPTATTLDFSKSEGVVFNGPVSVEPAATSGYDRLFDMTLSWWEGNVTFRRKFTLKGDATMPTIRCAVRYIACDNSQCRMPVTENLSKTVKR